jgi:hypothetical protein
MSEPPPYRGSVIEQTRVPLDLGKTALAEIKGAPGWIMLDHFEMNVQCHSNWCWAAVGEAVARFYNPNTDCTQRAIAKLQLGPKFGYDAACGSDDGLPSNIPETLQSVLNQFDCDGGGDIPGRPAPLEKVQQQIENHRPVCVRVRWADGTGHFVVITGFVPGTERLYVEDPLGPNPHEVSYSVLSKGYKTLHDGEWVDTYYTKPSSKMCTGA